MPSITSASTPERISFLASASAGAKQISLAPLRLDPLDRAARRKPAGEHDMADLVLRADVDQLAQLRMHGDEVDAERPVGARLGLGDFGVEQLGGHRAAGDHAEAAGIGDGGDEVALGDPAHRAAQDRDVAAEELGAAVHQFLEARVSDGRMHRARFGDQPLAAHAAFSASRPKAVWSTRTASSSSSSAIRALTLISLVEIASRLMPPLGKRLEHLRRKLPGWSACRRRRC